MRTARAVAVLFTAMAALLLGACAEGTLVGAADPGTLDATVWRAVDLNGVATIAGGEPTLIFRTDQVLGSTGCNQYFGVYSYDPSTGHIDIDISGMTAAACADPARNLAEASFLDLLARTDSAGVNAAGRLVLSAPGGAMVLTADTAPVPTATR